MTSLGGICRLKLALSNRVFVDTRHSQIHPTEMTTRIGGVVPSSNMRSLFVELPPLVHLILFVSQA
jgi:hypothetical protein